MTLIHPAPIGLLLALRLCAGPSDVCVEDLRWLARDLRENYAGYEDKVDRYGVEALEEAERTAGLMAAGAASGAACDAALWSYAAAFHDPHVRIQSPHSDGPPGFERPAILFPNRTPEFRLVSDSVAMIRVPSFAVERRAAVDSIVESHDAELASRPLMIVDVRQNGGGGDGTFYPLLPLLKTRPFRLPGLDHRATADNADRWRELAERFGGDEETRAGMWAFADSLRRAAPGWLRGPATTTLRVEPARNAPRVVAILTDRWCASACEQFLYLARQSSKVHVYGEPTAGAVDYLNLVPAPMPSEERVLLYPISRSRRLPAEPLDPTGIVPDIGLDERLLTTKEGAVEIVRALEGF